MSCFPGWQFCKLGDRLLAWRGRSRKDIPDFSCDEAIFVKMQQYETLVLHQKPLQKACLSLAYRSIPLSWNCLGMGSSIPPLHSDLTSSHPLSWALLRGNVPLPNINLLLPCRVQIVDKSCSACAITTRLTMGLEGVGIVICKPFNSLLSASHLSKAAYSKSMPYPRRGGGWKCPQIITSFSVTKAFVEFTSFPSFHFDCCNLTYFTVWCHTWRNRQIKESAGLWKTSAGKAGRLSHIND